MISSLLRGYQFRVVPESVAAILAVSLRCDRRAPRLARRAVETALEMTPILDDARLVTTELVNNAVLHSGCASDDIIRVMARLDGGFLIISVSDPGSGNEIGERSSRDRSEPRGFELHIVEQLAERWGAEQPAGHRVWAALPVTTSRSAEPAVRFGYASEC